jgi:hypothetical protein
LIQKEVSAWKASATRRRAIGSILLTLLVFATAAYLGFAYLRFSEVRPAEVIALAEEQLQPVIGVPESELTQQFVNAAPNVVGKLEASVVEMPAMIERRFYEHLNTELDTQLPEVEQQLAINFKEALKIARDHAVAAGKNPDDPKHVEDLMKEIAVLLRQEMQKTIEKFHADYTAQVSDLSNYMTLLAEGENLDQRQLLQRDVLIHFFALIENYQAMGNAAPVSAAH